MNEGMNLIAVLTICFSVCFVNAFIEILMICAISLFHADGGRTVVGGSHAWE